LGRSDCVLVLDPADYPRRLPLPTRPRFPAQLSPLFIESLLVLPRAVSTPHRTDGDEQPANDEEQYGEGAHALGSSVGVSTGRAFLTICRTLSAVMVYCIPTASSATRRVNPMYGERNLS